MQLLKKDLPYKPKQEKKAYFIMLISDNIRIQSKTVNINKV